MKRQHLQVLVAGILVFSACSNATTGDQGAAISSGANGIVETMVNPTTIPAGGTVQVTCMVTDMNHVPLNVSAIVTVSPTTGASILGSSLTLTQVGTYQVACAREDGQGVDTTPAIVTVTSGTAARTVATVEPATVLSGGTATATCRVEDAAGNELTGQNLALQVSDPQVAGIAGATLTGKSIGTTQVTCDVLGINTEVQVPATLTVNAGAVVGLAFQVNPDQQYYNLNDEVTIQAYGVDNVGNMIPGSIATVTPPATGVTHLGAGLYRFTTEGAHVFQAQLPGTQLTGARSFIVDGHGPDIDITLPERGATATGIPKVTVKGIVSDAISGVDTVKVNNYNVTLNSAGNFTLPMPVSHGLTQITGTATDNVGHQATATASVYHSKGWKAYGTEDPEESRLTGAMKVWMSQQALDDGDHNPEVLDDFATVLSVAMANLDFGTLGENGNFWSDSDAGVVDEYFMLGDVPVTLKGDALYSANIKSVSAPTADISLDSREGGLMMAGDFSAADDAAGLFITLNVLAELPITVSADVDLGGLIVTYNDTINPYVEWIVTVEVDNFDFLTDSDISKVAGQDLSVQIVDMEVNANGLHVEPFANVLIDLGEIDLPFLGSVDLGIWELEGLVGPLSNVLGTGFIDPIAELLVDVVTSDFLMPFVEDQMHPLLEEMIESLAMDRSMEIAPLIGDGEPVILTIDSELGTVTFTDAGADISVDAMAMGPDTLTLPDAGSILRVSCNGTDPGNYTFPKQDEMEVGLHMDLLNQVLHAAWRAGAFEFSLSGNALGSAANTIGLSTPVVQAKPLLPPIVDDCNSKKQLEVQIGDIRLDGSFQQNGQTVSLVAYVSATSDIVPVIENGTVSLVLGTLSNVTVEVEELQGGNFDEATFASFVEDVVVPDLLVGLAEGPLAELPLPTMQPALIADWFPEDVELSIGNDMDVVHLKGTLGIAGSLH